jgi:hypothetical protein
VPSEGPPEHPGDSEQPRAAAPSAAARHDRRGVAGDCGGDVREATPVGVWRARSRPQIVVNFFCESRPQPRQLQASTRPPPRHRAGHGEVDRRRSAFYSTRPAPLLSRGICRFSTCLMFCCFVRSSSCRVRCVISARRPWLISADGASRRRLLRPLPRRRQRHRGQHVVCVSCRALRRWEDRVPKSSRPRLQSVTVNLTPDLYRLLRRQAAAQLTSVSSLLRQLLLQNLQTGRDARHEDAK